MATSLPAASITDKRVFIPATGASDTTSTTPAPTGAPVLAVMENRAAGALQQALPAGDACQRKPALTSSQPHLASAGAGMLAPFNSAKSGHPDLPPTKSRESDSEDSGDADSEQEQAAHSGLQARTGDTKEGGEPDSDGEQLVGEPDSDTDLAPGDANGLVGEPDSDTERLVGDPDSDTERLVGDPDSDTERLVGDPDSDTERLVGDPDSDTERLVGDPDSDTERLVGDPDSDNDVPPDNTTPQPAILASAVLAGANQIPASQITIGKFLASGAFGQVFRGIWDGTDVALKKIDFAHASEGLGLNPEEVTEALEWEVARLATTQHPNLVQFHGICHKDGAPYLVLEFCHQGSMRGVLERSDADGKPIPASRLWQWMLEISQALAYLHEQGMLHRDLKAENILIDRHGRARLADLGVAQVDALLADSEASAVDQGLQDKSFIAPENLGKGKDRLSSKATDIYALGLVFWQMVSGGEQPLSWEQMHDQDPNLSAVRAGERMPIPADCPPQFKKLILACWSLYAAQRASIADVLQQLRDMAPAMHADHALMALAMQLEQALHPRRAEARHYVPCQVTLQPIEGPMERYWERFENHAGPATVPNAPQPLQQVFEDFLASANAGTLLLLGEGGLGKSLSMCMLADRIQQQWWQHFAEPASHPKPRYLPVFLRNHVASWTHAALKNACADALQRHGLQPGQATPLVFIDGYDEVGIDEENPGNLARHVGLPADARLIVTCRPGTVPEDQQQQRFALAGKLQGCHYLSFGTSQLLSYLKQHLAWDNATYQGYATKLQASVELRAVLRNPFVLYLLWQSWDTVSKKPLEKLTRSDIYEGFIEHMVNSGKGMVEDAVLQQLQASHGTLSASFTMFARDTALLAAKGSGIVLPLANAGQPGSPWAGLEALVQQQAQQRYQARQTKVSELSEAERKEQSRRMVLTEDDFVRLQRQKASQFATSLPLRPRGAVIEFIHKSVFEHCLAQRLLELLHKDDISLNADAVQKILSWTETSSPEALLMARAQLEASEAPQRTGKASPKQESIETRLYEAISKALDDRQLYADALEYMFKALAIKERLVGKEDINTAISYNNIGTMLTTLGKHTQAFEYLHKALAIKESKLGINHADTAISYGNIGRLLVAQDKPDEALGYFHKALFIQENVLGNNHLDTARSYSHIGTLLQEQRKHEQAQAYIHKAQAIYEKLRGADHTDTAESYNRMGSQLQAQGDYGQALAYYYKALAIQEKVLGTDHTGTAVSHFHIGTLLEALGKYEQALEYLHKALAINQKVHGTDHADIARIYDSIALVLRAQGNQEEALEYCFKAIGIQKKILGTDHTDLAKSYNNAALLLEELGRLEQALDYHYKALAVNENVPSIDHAANVPSLNSIGALLCALGKPEQALDCYRKALDISRKVSGTDHVDTIGAYNAIGMTLQTLGRYEQALEYFVAALNIYRKANGNNANTAGFCNNVGNMHHALGQYEEALAHYQQALSMAVVLDDLDLATRCRRNIASLSKSNAHAEAQVVEHRVVEHDAVDHKVSGHTSSDHEKVLDPYRTSIDNARSYNDIGSQQQAQGHYEQALESHRKALAIQADVLGIDHIETSLSYAAIAGVLHELGRPEQALEHCQKALAIQEKAFGAEHIETARTYGNLGLLLSAQGKQALALQYQRKALIIYEKELGTEHIDTAGLYDGVGWLLQALGEDDQALEHYLKALAARKKALGDHADTANSCNIVGEMHQAVGHREEALTYYQHSLTIAMKLGVADVEAQSRRNIASLSEAQAEADHEEPKRSKSNRKKSSAKKPLRKKLAPEDDASRGSPGRKEKGNKNSDKCLVS